jgi:CRISPR system Cascade subunit CasE
MSWLARFEIEAETARAKGIYNDIYSWHRLLWECYPGEPNSKRDFLTRIDELEGAFRLWVMAQRKPSKPTWCPSEGFALKKIASGFLSHRFYAFDLLANPTKCKITQDYNGKNLMTSNGKLKRGKRVTLVKHDELRSWIIKKGKVRCKDKITGLDVPGGFRIVEEKPLEISPMIEFHFCKKGQSGYHGGVRFRGILQVTDRVQFIETYHLGIGSAKAFGFGLLLLAPIYSLKLTNE